MRILGVIPARGGSKRIPRKNLQSVGGMSLVERAIRQACDAHLLDDVCLSTDDDEIATRMHIIMGADPIWRPAQLAIDSTPMAPVLLHAAEATGGNWDAVVTIQPTSPLRTARDIDRAIAVFLEDDPDSVCSVIAGTRKRNGAVYVTWHELLETGRVFVDDDSWRWARYEMPPERSLDINTPEDLEEARRLLGP